MVDIETGLALPPYKEGELWLKGLAIMKGYLRNEEATNATLDKDGWLKIGDLGYFNADDFLFIVDMIKELIKHNGYQVIVLRSLFKSPHFKSNFDNKITFDIDCCRLHKQNWRQCF